MAPSPITVDLPPMERVTTYAENDLKILKKIEKSLDNFAENHQLTTSSLQDFLVAFFSNPLIKDFLTETSRLPVFSHDIHVAFKNELPALGGLKKLKYFFNLPIGQLFVALDDLYAPTPVSKWWRAAGTAICASNFSAMKVSAFLKETGLDKDYDDFAYEMEKNDPHAVYPTNIYRQCDGCTVSTEDFSTIESVMSTTLTTTIKIRKNVLDSDNDTLANVYKTLGRCIAIVDDKVQKLFGADLAKYFAHHEIKYMPLVYKGNEVDKEIGNVEKILVDLKKNGVSRNEPVLIVGGGVISDIGGFACALYHRSTPYVMLCTSIVSGIDAGPSPRTCCDGFGYKNLYGAYHPPILTITDRFFFKTLHPGWLRHGIAEIIKMSVTKDYELFKLLEKAGPRLITSKFGTCLSEADGEFEELCDLIIGRALDSYVKSEYGNLWETHQCRPHAYGHTWSPGYELSAGMLHGHAVATGMGFGAYLSKVQGWISDEEFKRILGLISVMELSLWHPIMDDVDMIWSSQVKMIQKRGNNLCAPIPRESIGKCGYLNDMPYDMLKAHLAEYKEICQEFPRQGFGVEVHCADVGLEDPSVTAKAHVRSEKGGQITTSYQEWIEQAQKDRNAGWKLNVSLSQAEDTEAPPEFAAVTLFHEKVEEYAMANTSLSSGDIQSIAKETSDNELFAPCMVGTLESQFLKMQAQISGAKKVLDIGTFTGMSALALAEGLPEGGSVVTLESNVKCADVAQACFDKAEHGRKINLIRGDALGSMKKLLENGEKFDIIFVDADKENYIKYYEMAMDGLLDPKGMILADNSMCALLYDATDERSQKLHEFNQFVKNDDRVEQVILTIREGITLIKPVSAK